MAAACADSAAAHRLAGWYRGGEEGLPQSSELAFRWALRAAERGHVEAQYNTGLCYNTGEGVAADYEAAAMWFGRAAEQGERSAQFNLGFAVELGKGTPLNCELAAKWFQRAADQGATTAKVHLGNLYRAGHGVEQDHAHANALYREAIEVDNTIIALFN